MVNVREIELRRRWWKVGEGEKNGGSEDLEREESENWFDGVSVLLKRERERI